MRVLAMNASSLYFGLGHARARAGPCRPRVRGVDRPKNRRAKRLGLSVGEKRRLVGEHLRVRAQIGGDDRPARSQVLIDLERRVRAGRSRRREDGRGVEVGRHFFGGPLAGEHDDVRDAQRVDLRFALRRPAPARRRPSRAARPAARARRRPSRDRASPAPDSSRTFPCRARRACPSRARAPRESRRHDPRPTRRPTRARFRSTRSARRRPASRTVVSRSWQITMTTRERRIMSRSNQPSIRVSHVAFA